MCLVFIEFLLIGRFVAFRNPLIPFLFFTPFFEVAFPSRGVYTRDHENTTLSTRA